MTVDLGGFGSYLCVMFRFLLIIMLVSAPAVVWSVPASVASPERPAEYMIYQYPDVGLVVKIDAPGVEFKSKIYGPENALIKSSELPFGRIGPLYQYIDAVDVPRQLMIKISPVQKTDRSRISMELIQLTERDRNSAALAQAYRLLSHGIESDHSNDSTTWAMKAYTLRNAAAAFASLGWEEMRLWSDFYAAHIVLHKLNDVTMTLDMSREIQDAAQRAGFERVVLAALILEGDALMSAGASRSDKLANARLEQAHGVLDRIIILTDQRGLETEQARALFNDGLAYERQGQLDAAVRQFQRALDVAATTEDSELANNIRGKAAAVYETLGSTAGAIEMLEDIGAELENDAGLDAASNLAERGRILISNYRYPQAADELSQALNLQKSAAALSSWGPTGLALAWSYYSMGDTEQAASLIIESIPRVRVNGNREALFQAYNVVAHYFREQGDFRQVTGYRDRQRALIRSEEQRTEFTYESAMDAWSREGPGSAGAGELLDRVRRQSIENGQFLSRYRAEMLQCLLRLEQKGRAACGAAEVSRQRAALRNSGMPKLAVEADFVNAGILRREGRVSEALASIERLIDEIRFYRQTLPGVVGAWYWQNKEALFQEYMTAALGARGGSAGPGRDGALPLLALNRIRLLEADEQRLEGAIIAPAQDEALRAALARRETVQGREAETLAAQINGDLGKLREEFEPLSSPLTPASLENLLSGLERDDSLLTYYFSGTADYVLIGKRKGVSLLKLPGALAVADQLHALREQISQNSSSVTAGLDRMGQLLVKPLSAMLTKKIYLLPAGPLNGFPFNALRVEGKFLAEKHEVVNLTSLASLSGPRPLLGPNDADRVFLAGNPQTGQALFSYDMQVSPEIARFTDRFVGPGLHIVQGVALTAEEFTDARLTQAGLIHLAIPGTINLAFPDRSSLLMSRSGEDRLAGNLTPRNIRELDFEAGLAVLSQTTVTGASRSAFDSRIGFVSDFLDGGVKNVVASLWFDGGVESEAFLSDFYDALQADGDVVEALSLARKARLKPGEETNFRSWAGFQLFIR